MSQHTYILDKSTVYYECKNCKCFLQTLLEVKVDIHFTIISVSVNYSQDLPCS